MTALFFELFSGLPRQGPGDAASKLLRERHHGEPDAQGLADQVSREIDVWRRYSDYFGYEFFVTRAR